jgi:hypothetical protein
MGKWTILLRGQCHQGYPYFTDKFAGRQCTVMALVALCFAYLNPGTDWHRNDINCAIVEGHQRYIENIESIGIGIRNLQHNEVPRYFHGFMGLGDVEVDADSHSFYGVVGKEADHDAGAVPFQTAIRQSFLQSDFMLATFSEYTIALFYNRQRNMYSLFDSHSCDDNGCTSNNGVAVLLEFNSQESFISYLKERHLNSVFEVSNVSFSYPDVSFTKFK